VPDKALREAQSVVGRRPRRWTLIGDVGGAHSYHVGDEAMLESNVRLLRTIDPDATLHVVSADPAFTAAAYEVEGLPRLGFDNCASDGAREALLARLSHMHWTSETPGAFARMADESDGLLISGGGNLRSTWPNCIYERVALCRKAVANGAPIIILGQTLGPELNARHRELVSEIVRAAWWIGVREAQSFAFALELGALPERLSYQIDDAAELWKEAADTEPACLPFSVETPWIGITFHPFVDPTSDDPLLDQLADQLEQTSARTGCRLVFIPHARAAATMGAPWSDEDVGLALARRMRSTVLHLMPVLSARQVARLTGQAQMIVSSRYHPIVFGLAQGVPCLGIWADLYTRTKLCGALQHFDRADDSCSLEGIRQQQLARKLAELWNSRAAAREKIHALGLQNDADEQRRRRQLVRLVMQREAADTPQPDRLAGILATAMREPHAFTAPFGSGEPTRKAPMTEAMPRHATAGRALPASLHLKKDPKMLTDADWQSFSRDGFLHLGQVLDAQQVQALQQRADALALGQISNPAIQMQCDTGGAYEALPEAVSQFEEGTRLYRKIQGLETDDLFAALIDRPLFREICAHIYGAHAAVSIFRAMVMNKPAGQGTYLPWHQDGGTVWQLDRDPQATIWVALDPATRDNGCMDAIRGSHRLGLLSLHGSTLTEEHVREYCRDDLTVPLEVPAGHAVLLHNWLIHRSGINPSSTPRRAFTMCCMDARTRGILTGDHFPVVFGEQASEPDPFVRQLKQDHAAQTDKATQAEEYALSLRDQNTQLQMSIAEATKYAQSLEAQAATLQQHGLDLEDARQENRRLANAVTQMRGEMLALSRALDAAAQPPQAAQAAQAAHVAHVAHVAHALQEELNTLRVHAEQLAASMQAVYASNSWRVTRPLRAMFGVLRNQR
jgi:polysaccharide pyruvyl transferase WcaK-like protein